MKALTIKQPWVDAICYFGKRVENRTWQPPKSIIGERIAIHAGKAFDNEGHKNFYRNELVGPHGVVSFGMWMLASSPKRPRGAVLATAVVERATSDGDSPWFTGPVGWVLRDVCVLEVPVPCRGAQGVWTLPPLVAEMVTNPIARKEIPA